MLRSILAAEKSADAAKNAANISNRTLIATQRAWLKVEISPQDEIAFDVEGVKLGVSFTINNIGNAPAINIRTFASLVVLKGDLRLVRETLKRESEEVKHGKSTISFFLFPGETFPKDVGIGSVSHGFSAANYDIAEALTFSEGSGFVYFYTDVRLRLE
jgi:hypothetical protein